MKIFIDWLKKAITKIEHDNELYVGNQFSNKFDVYFFNVGTDTDWFPTLTQLAPNGRETGPFTADSDSFTTTTIDNVTYLTATFTMGTGYAFIKGVSSFFLYENRITTPHQTKSVIGKFIVTLNKSDEGYFLDDPEFNPKVKEYVDKYSQLRFGGEASTSVIEALTSNQGVWLATDTGYYWYWDYDNNEYVRGNLFQAVSVADNGITTAKIADGAVTEDKIAPVVKNKINNAVQKGENNPTAASNVRTIISNSNSQEEDVDSSYGSNIVLGLDEAEVEHSYYSGGTTKYSGIKFDEYHDDTANEDYPRTVIETAYQDYSTPETSKITILKDLIELLTGGKISLQATDSVDIRKGNSYFKIIQESNNKDYAEIYSKNNVIIDGLDFAHLGTDSYEIDVVDGVGFKMIYLDDQLFLVDTTGFKSNVPFYYNNKELSTKEYADTKVPKSDIVDNLTSNDSTKPLSAAQGKILKGFIDSINTLLESDDTTLDQLQEIVDYIKNNKSLIDGITTSKVSVSDIINNLTSTATNKPLSANQGYILKGLIDSLQASISAINNSINGIKNGTNINSFGAVETALEGLDDRVSELEENPTSNVSGTNDGTNWTSITIGNETYGIPSGSSGGSGSGAYYEIKTSDIAFYDGNGAPITTNVLDNLRITLSEGQFEALKVKMGLPSSATINDLLTQVNSAFTETQADSNNTAYQLFVILSGYCQFWSESNNMLFEFALLTFGYGLQALGGNNYYSWFTMVDGNETPMGISATWTLSQYGTSGGSSSSESYDLQAGDVTIVGAGIGATDYEVTLSQDLLDVINEGKKSLFVSGTLVSTFTNGDITTPVLFNNINYKKVTAPNYDEIYGYQNITDLSTFTEMTIVFGYVTATQKWYLGLLNVDYNLYQMDYDISSLDTRVTTLENAGGTELYEHHIRLIQTSNTYSNKAICFTLTCSTPSFTKASLFTYLTTGLVNAVISATGYVSNAPSPTYEKIVYAIRPQSSSITIDVLNNANVDATYDTTTTENYASTAYNNSSTTLTDTVIKIL